MTLILAQPERVTTSFSTTAHELTGAQEPRSGEVSVHCSEVLDSCELPPLIGRRHGRRQDRRWAKSWSPETNFESTPDRFPA